MNIQIYDRHSIDQVAWPSTPDGAYARSLLGPLIRHGPQRLIDNADAEVRVLVAGDLVLPLVLGNPAPSVKNSYVCSPTTHYIDYAKREVEIELHDQPVARALMPPMLDLLRPLLLWSKFEQVVFVNNWLLSTNLYPSMPHELMQSLRDLLVRSFPQHAVIFRSVNDQLNAALVEQLQTMNFRKVFSRQVYILDPHDSRYQQKKSYQKDRSLARRSTYSWANAAQIQPADIARIKALYDDLYLKKYSFYNPQFNRHFFAAALRDRWLTFLVLKRQGRIDGVLGFVERNGVMTTPLIGYDRSVDAAAGLYRLISLELVEQAAARGLILHQSSGAAAFKRHRGSTASMEYNLIYDRHLAPRYRLPWQLLEALSRGVIMPVMRRYGL
jgi:GNAT acetyltransferase-like protein